MSEFTLTGRELEQAAVEADEETFQMDDESFRGFYQRTARPLWSYLSRVSGDAALADDLVQETYYRFLRAKLPEMSEAYRKNYLFRIGTNLLCDHQRRGKGRHVSVEEMADLSTGERTEDKVQAQFDLSHAFGRLKPRERELLWLAYVEGSSHQEIADVTGLKAKSIRLLLFRARRNLAGLLRKAGLGVGREEK